MGKVVGIKVTALFTVVSGEHTAGIGFELVFPAKTELATEFETQKDRFRIELNQFESN